uniref:F-box domain-containing protein n=1 Tax=Oryza rufipogon TaxID=4529 RepID=A0A0E0PGQ5_ORYRU
MASDDSSPPDAKRLRRSPPTSTSPDHLLVDEILTRLPIAAAVRLRAVSRDWNAALTTDHFILAHRARAAAARHPELLFFAPPDHRNTTTFYACSLRGCEPPAAARELLTIDYFSAKHAVMSPTPCRGLTLVSDGRAPRYLPSMTPWRPFELSTTGLGFDTATDEHKVVRLFKRRNGEHACEVYTLGKPGGWRPCAGRVPASAASILPAMPPVSDELMEERVIVPLCTAGGRILLATGRHEVFAYDAGRNAVERVFRMQEFVDVPNDCREARLLLSVGLHDECIADLHPGAGGERMLFVNTGRRGNTVVKREVPVEYHDDSDRRFNVFFKDLATMAAQI